MKKLEELTELEIKDLSYDDIQLLIKLRKAEEGVKFITRPIEPEYFKIPEKDLTVYSIKFLGNSLVFKNMADTNQFIDLVKKSEGMYKLDYGVESTYYANPNLYPYSGEWDEVSSQSVYNNETYSTIKDLIQKNSKLKKEYDTLNKEYKTSIDESKWIKDEIEDKVYEVQRKYQQLNDYCYYFKRDYLPLAGDDKKIALAFMNKAYTLSFEQQEYILTNYEKAK